MSQVQHLTLTHIAQIVSGRAVVKLIGYVVCLIIREVVEQLTEVQAGVLRGIDVRLVLSSVVRLVIVIMLALV